MKWTKAKLKKAGYDGLRHPDEPCGCGIDDLVPCGCDEEDIEDCEPAYQQFCEHCDVKDCSGRGEVKPGRCWGPKKDCRDPKPKEDS